MDSTTKPFEFYENVAKKVLTIEDNDLGTYALKIGIYRASVAKCLYHEETYKIELEQNLDMVYKEKLHDFKYNSDIIIDKKDMDTYIKATDEFRMASKELQTQEIKIKFINEILNTLNNQSYLLNTAVKHEIWKAGGEA